MANNGVFDLLFKQALGLERYANYLSQNASAASAFPPYNILVDDEDNPTKFTIELAVAGFSRDQLTVKLVKDTGIPVLVIEGQKSEDTNRRYHFHGLAGRAFVRRFTLSNDMRATSVELKDGILTIKLEVVRPADAEVVLDIK